MPKVSIIMPILNGAEYLEETLESILNQTFQDFELIVVDSHSIDDTPLIVNKFAKRSDKVKYYLTDAHLTLSGNLNAGFAYATGEYWTRISCDDVYLPNALERMVFHLDADPLVGFVYCDMDLIDAEGKFIRKFIVCSTESMAYGNSIGLCIMYRGSLAKKLSGYSEEWLYCEDYEYWLRFYQITTLKPIHECLMRYRMHQNNLSTKHEQFVIKLSIKLQKSYYHQFINTRRKAALFYAHIRARDIFNPYRQFYLLLILFYSPAVFWQVVYNRTIPES